jgi:hypothetical protein
LILTTRIDSLNHEGESDYEQIQSRFLTIRSKLNCSWRRLFTG